MWRFTILVKRAANCGPERFGESWLEASAPQLLARTCAAGPVTRASVNIPPPELDPRLEAIFPPLYDGMAELWFEGREAAEATLAELARADFPALEEVIDRAKSTSWLAEARPVKPDSGSAFTFLAAGAVSEKMGVDEALRYWAEEHPRVARTAPQVWDRLALYTQFHGVAPPAGMFRFFAPPRFVPMCSDMGFATQEDFVLLYASEQYRTIVRPDEEKFGQPGEMLAFATEHHRSPGDGKETPANA